MTMTKKEILFGVLECENVLKLDYHDYIKSDYFDKTLYDDDFYSVWLSQRNITTGMLHHILLYSNGIDPSYYRTVFTRDLETDKPVKRVIKPIPYTEFVC